MKAKKLYYRNNIFNNTINYIYQKFKELKYIKKIAIEKKEYLCPGHYSVIGKGQRIIYLNNTEAQKFIEKNALHIFRKDTKGNRVKLCAKKVLMPFTKITVRNNSNPIHQGTLVIIGRKKTIKIIDFINKIIVCFNNKKDYILRIKNAYERFGQYFNIPHMTFNEECNCYFEEYIEYIPYSHWTEKEKDDSILVLFEQFDKYFQGLSNNIINYISIDHLASSFINQSNHIMLNDKTIDIIKNMSDDIFPLVPLHGDLIFDNILLHDQKYYLIDWEDSSEYIFYYDLFNLIFMEAYFKDNNHYLLQFLNGSYDIYLSNLFRIFSMKYDPNYKQFYTMLYFMMRILRDEDNQQIMQNGLSHNFYKILIDMDSENTL